MLLRATVGVMAVACGAEPQFVQPTTTPGSDGDPGTVQRAALVVTVTVPGPDSALAARIGSADGVLRDAVVTIQRAGSAAPGRSDTTDAAGQATFDTLLPGTYAIAVLRSLSAGEVAALDTVDRDVMGFGGGGVLQVNPPAATTAVVAQAGRRGSLVISELDDNMPIVNGVVYSFATFVEVYNNSDTTIYLDGKILGFGLPFIHDCSRCVTPRTCADYAPYMLDSAGLWSRYHARFPGAGRDYPLPPGQAAVVATDAVDHSVVDPSLPDLRFVAGFEYVGSTDADNPSVPNMIELSPDEPYWQTGHGSIFGVIPSVFLADTLTIESQPRATIPPLAYSLPRIPREKILDVFASAGTPEFQSRPTQLPLCASWISSVFDRQPGSLHDEYDGNSIVRRQFSTLPDGRVILLKTHATANDFTLGGATPGRVP